MDKKHSYWRKINIGNNYFKRADLNYREVFINDELFRLCKCEDKDGQEGKWLLFNPVDKFLARCQNVGPPMEWADKKISEGFKNG